MDFVNQISVKGAVVGALCWAVSVSMVPWLRPSRFNKFFMTKCVLGIGLFFGPYWIATSLIEETNEMLKAEAEAMLPIDVAIWLLCFLALIAPWLMTAQASDFMGTVRAHKILRINLQQDAVRRNDLSGLDLALWLTRVLDTVTMTEMAVTAVDRRVFFLGLLTGQEKAVLEEVYRRPLKLTEPVDKHKVKEALYKMWHVDDAQIRNAIRNVDREMFDTFLLLAYRMDTLNKCLLVPFTAENLWSEISASVSSKEKVIIDDFCQKNYLRSGTNMDSFARAATKNASTWTTSEHTIRMIYIGSKQASLEALVTDLNTKLRNVEALTRQSG